MTDHYRIWGAGLVGAVVALPYQDGIRTKAGRIAFVLTGAVTADYVAPVVASHFGATASGVSLAGFACGMFAGTVIAKATDIIRSIRASDVLAVIAARFGR
ncbi:hypothetical protein AAC691_15485 [Nguyenibacter vanlangensis]|uniref:Holin n=1 Tax=Nguyenibacter vanlangensis TaxID=1216886 RepID=A0ABZ3D1P5_9PROT